jgi:hypothetical protein
MVAQPDRQDDQIIAHGPGTRRANVATRWSVFTILLSTDALSQIGVVVPPRGAAAAHGINAVWLISWINRHLGQPTLGDPPAGG